MKRFDHDDEEFKDDDFPDIDYDGDDEDEGEDNERVILTRNNGQIMVF